MGLKHRLRRWLLESDIKSNALGAMSHKGLGSNANFDQSHGIHFSIYPASGGNVVKCAMYDSITDRRHTSLHVIPSGDKLAESIARIITTETLANR